jgi:hypothetical protein
MISAPRPAGLNRRVYWFLGPYLVVLVLLAPQLTLWLDEILLLLGARLPDLASVVGYSAHNAGGVPLGYVFTHWSIQLLGYTELSARLPSVVSSLAACLGLARLAAKVSDGAALPTVVLFAALPLQFRYAMEARPYATALAVSIWLTLGLLWLLDRPTPLRAAAYSAVVCAGVYTQPYTLFLPAAHFLWLAAVRRSLRTLSYVGAGTALACALFLPWYLYGVQFWRAEITTYRIAPHFGLNEIQLLLKELTGAGYLGTVLLLGLAIYGYRGVSSGLRGLFLACTLTPLLGGIAANLYLGYFFAIRQFIFVLWPLSLFAGLALSQFIDSQRWPQRALLLLTGAGFIYADVRYFLKPRENWEAAARMLAGQALDHTCVLALPADSIRFYVYFQPVLARALCAPSPGEVQVALAHSPYEPVATRQAAELALAAAGRKKLAEQHFNGPEIALFSPPAKE